MVEPSDNLQAVFEKAIDTAKKLHHEYLTIEHLLYAMLLEEPFGNVITGFGANLDELKNDLTDYLHNKCQEITITDVVVKPKKTQSVERVLNRAFTQVLFQAFYNKQTVVNCFSEEYSKVIKLIEKQNLERQHSFQCIYPIPG